MALPVSEDGHDSADTENDAGAGRTPGPDPGGLRTSTGSHKVFGMANPDRPYNMWAGKYRPTSARIEFCPIANSRWQIRRAPWFQRTAP